MPAAAKSKPKSVRKRSKRRMSVDYPRDVENVAPAATSKAKAAPRSPILERVASAVEKVFSPQKKVPATTPRRPRRAALCRTASSWRPRRGRYAVVARPFCDWLAPVLRLCVRFVAPA